MWEITQSGLVRPCKETEPSVAFASSSKCLTMWKCHVQPVQEEVVRSCSKGGIRQNLRLLDCLTHIETSSLAFQFRGLKEDTNKQIFSKINMILGGELECLGPEALQLAAGGVGWPRWQWPPALWEALPGLGSSSTVHLGLGQADGNPSELFVLDFTHPCKQANKTASEPLDSSCWFTLLNEIICEILTFSFLFRLKGVTIYLGLKK